MAKLTRTQFETMKTFVGLDVKTRRIVEHLQIQKGQFVSANKFNTWEEYDNAYKNRARNAGRARQSKKHTQLTIDDSSNQSTLKTKLIALVEVAQSIISTL